MSVEDLDELIKAGEKIAKAVQAFPPEVRQAAYDDMMAAFRGVPSPQKITRVHGLDPGADENENEAPPTPTKKASAARKTAKKVAPKKVPAKNSRSKSAQPTVVRDYNFWPDGKQSFADFVAEKSPQGFIEMNLAAVYWLAEVAGEPDISVGHVLAAYNAAKWRAPTDPTNSLRVTASRHKWIDTSDSSSIKVLHIGRRHIEFDMPSAEPAKKAAKSTKASK
ncbi:hypothetical protein K1W54_24995 [Micromonospora sp. CPCC 205371]|nr:hypothetical protein [Micromonospora sp. CPCC 205371]